MKLLALLGAAAALIAVSATADAQSKKPSLGDRLKIHPRRLAFNNKDGRHQIRVQSRKDRHKTRREVRKVTHKLTTPHNPPKKGRG